MTESFQVRRLGASDADELANALDRFVRSKSGNTTSGPSYLAHLVRALSTPSCYVFLASEAGSPIGYVSGFRFPRLDEAGEQVYVFDIEVVPDARSRGVGRRLLESLLKTCWEDGVTWAWAGTARDNTPAKRLFAAVGGRAVGERYVEYHFTPGD